MSNSLLDLLGTLPAEIILTYAYTLFLPMRHPRLFFAVRIGLCAVVALARSYFGPEFRIVVGFFLLYVIIPLLFSSGKIAQRIFMLALISITLAISEFLGVLLWTGLTGEPNIEYDLINANISSFLLVHLSHALVLILLLSGLYALFRHLVQNEAPGGARYFFWFPITQFLLLFVMIETRTYLLSQSTSFIIGSVLLIAFCVLVDVLLFVTLNNYGKKELDEQHARALAQELDCYLRHYDDVVVGVEHVAKVKHDFRNQLHVVSHLIAQGNVAEARTHIEAMEAFVETDPLEKEPARQPCGGMPPEP